MRTQKGETQALIQKLLGIGYTKWGIMKKIGELRHDKKRHAWQTIDAWSRGEWEARQENLEILQHLLTGKPITPAIKQTVVPAVNEKTSTKLPPDISDFLASRLPAVTSLSCQGTLEKIRGEIGTGWQQRRFDESFFHKSRPWSPAKAYVLGQFKAGGNLQPDETGFNVTRTNLQFLIKLQIWLRSNHKIYPNTKQKEAYDKGSVIYTFHVHNKLMVSDLRKLGFVGLQGSSAKNNAPIPEDMPKELMPHFLRGFLDDRGHPMPSGRGQVRYRINYAKASFLREIVDILEAATGIKTRNGLPRKIHKAGTKNSHYVNFDGKEALKKIFNYLYEHPIESGLYDTSTYINFCERLDCDSAYENIDLDLDMKSLYVLHAYCCERGIDPNAAIKFNLPNFLNFCKSRNAISGDQEKIINEGKGVAANFCGVGTQVDWGSAFQNIIKIVGANP